MYWQQKGEYYDFCHIAIKHGNWMQTVTVIIQATKKQEEVSIVILCTFVEYQFLGVAKE